jgi:hypothetical protein
MPIEVEYNGTVYEFPDDATDAEISAALESVSPASRSMTGTTPAAAERNGPNNPQGARNRVLNDVDRRMGNMTGFARRNAPTLAAMMTAPFLGPSIPIALAATGGAATAGSVARSLTDDEPETPEQVAGTAVVEGAKNAAPQLLRGLPRLGNWLWRSGAGESRASVADDVLTRGRGVPTRQNSDALRREAMAGSTPAQPAVPATSPSQVLGPNGLPLSPGSPAIPAQPAQFSPLWQAANAHSKATKGMSGPTWKSALGAATSLGAGAAFGSPGVGAAGAVLGAVAHPATRMAAGQGAYSLGQRLDPNLPRLLLLQMLEGQQ